MVGSVPNIFKIPDLRNKILFTLGMVVVYRLGCHIPVPGINAQALGWVLHNQLGGSVFGLYDIFVGGALGRAAVFSLGIMPYISASIIFQLMGSVFPYLEKLQREEQGRKKINQYTRYLTVGLAVLQSASIAVYLESQHNIPLPSGAASIVANPVFMFRIITILTLTAGTILVMWLSERITDKGIGNGASFIIFVGCLDDFPRYFGSTIRSVAAGTLSPLAVVLLAAIIIGVYAGTVLVTQAIRKIPVQYPKRIIGRRMYGGQSTHVPVRINLAGVMPIIFAQSLIVFPGTFAAFAVPRNADVHSLNAAQKVAHWLQTTLSAGRWSYEVLYGVLIIFFTYFYTSVVFNPQDLADNMQRQGGFVPGIRPGERTAEFIDRIVSRITVVGALFLVFMAVLPTILTQWMKAPFYFGGTTLLIIVGVALDTIQQIESHLLMRHYEGLLKGSKIRGRRSF